MCLSSPPAALADPPPQAASTTRMAERLAAAADRLESAPAGEGRFFRRNAPGRIPALRARIAGEPASRALQLRVELARELLWDGRSAEALAEFTRIHQAVAAAPPAGPADRRNRAALLRWLAVSSLRLGEQRNCLRQPGPTACLFPIEGDGVHADPRGSRGALAWLRRELALEPSDLGARWLLNIASMTLGEYPEGVPERWRIAPEVFASERDPGRFPNVAAGTHTDVEGLAGGVALDDFDGDGRLDLVVTSWGPRDGMRFLRNTGDGTFEDRTRAAGLEGLTGGLNANHADYDNDGDPDVLVLRGGWLGAEGDLPDSLLRNEGDGTFVDVTEAAGVLVNRPGQTAAWADFDGDGWLDLFVGHETVAPGPPQPCQLLHNTGDGGFRDVAEEVGLAALGFVKGAAWGDVDNDGRPDLYVSRMGQPNLLFRNGGPGGEGGPAWRFREVAAEAGVSGPRFSFPTWFFDYDNDGWLDLFVAGWDGAGAADVAAGYLSPPPAREHPRLYRNRGDGTFEDVTRAVALDRVLLAMGANFGDLDNDGWLDLYVGTGAPDLSALMPNRMFRNDGGQRFEDVTTSGGFGHLQKGHGVAFGDLDNDGDQDLYAVMGGWYSGDVARNALFENPGHGNRWLALRLVGVRSNRSGVGARIAVRVRTSEGERTLHRQVGTGGSFGSSSLQQEIGLGAARGIAWVEVVWPASGVIQRFADVAPDRAYLVREGAESLEPLARPRLTLARGAPRQGHAHPGDAR